MLERELVSLAQDRKLPAFRHRQGMEKKGARTAGGASALLPQARYPAGDQIATGHRCNSLKLLQFQFIGAADCLASTHPACPESSQVLSTSMQRHEMSFLRI
jgi:hypothetical protein